MNLNIIPYEIQHLIKEYLWGSPNIWKQILNINDWKLLRQSLHLKFYPKNTSYCSICGDKKYILDYNSIKCYSCNNSIEKYAWKYTTWSGTNQGHFKLNGTTICLYSGPLSPLEKNILCMPQNFPNIHPIA